MNHTLPALELSVSRQFIFDQWSHHIHHRPLMLVAYIQSNISLTSSLHLPCKKDGEELTTKVASFQQRTKPLWIGLRPSLSDFLLHLPGALPFGRVLPRLSDMHPCDASPTAVQAL